MSHADIFLCPKSEIMTVKMPWHKIREKQQKSKIKRMSSIFKPLADRVLIEPVAVEQVTASGIIIPDTAKEKPLKGKIIAVGPGKKDEPMHVKENDVVIYGQYSGTEIKIDGKDYLIMKEADIYGIIG